MPRHYMKTDTDVEIVALMLGCKPDSGLVNTMNGLATSGEIGEGDTYGWILRKLLLHELARLGEPARRPVEAAAA